MEEGIRITLEKYKEYAGLFIGETLIVTLTRNILECQNKVEKATEECKDADGFIGSIACEIAGGIDKLVCIGSEVVDRIQ